MMIPNDTSAIPAAAIYPALLTGNILLEKSAVIISSPADETPVNEGIIMNQNFCTVPVI
jgi:hypothetical protein